LFIDPLSFHIITNNQRKFILFYLCTLQICDIRTCDTKSIINDKNIDIVTM